MVEYVYARHDFSPEYDDEIPFRAGERIEIVEKDDDFGDGRWEVRFARSDRLPRIRIRGSFSSEYILISFSRQLHLPNLTLLFYHTSFKLLCTLRGVIHPAVKLHADASMKSYCSLVLPFISLYEHCMVMTAENNA
jgi:hypothetical protein